MSNNSIEEISTERIDELNRQAWDIRISNSNKAFEVSIEAIELSRKINYEKGNRNRRRVF